MNARTWKKWTCWTLCLFLLSLPACGGGGSDNTSSGGGSVADANSMIVQVTFSETMDTGNPPGVAVAGLFRTLFGPSQAHAASWGERYITGDFAGTIRNPLWRTKLILALEIHDIDRNLRAASATNHLTFKGFRTLSGNDLATFSLAFTLAGGTTANLNYQVP